MNLNYRFFSKDRIAQNIFLIICIIFSSIFICINPPFQAPDEPEHLFKMYGYTEGSLNFKKLNGKPGQILPESIVNIDKTFYPLKFDGTKKTTKTQVDSFKTVKLNKDKTVFYEFTPSSYTPFSYFPFFILLWLLKLFNVPPLLMLYIMKFFSMFVYTALMYTAIRITPINKMLFALIGILPMAMYQGSAISSDPLVTGLCFIYIAWVLKLSLDESSKFSKKEYWIFGLLITWISICKFAYLPLIFMFFMIPKNKFLSSKNRLIYFWSLLFLNLIYVAAFLIHTINISQGLVPYFKTYQQLDKGELIKFILAHPIWYLKACLQTLMTLTVYYLETLIGRLGWINVILPSFVLKGYTILLAVTCLFTSGNEPDNMNLTLKMKMIMFGIYSACLFIIMTSVFLIFQYFPIIKGVQGRYLIPIVPLFCLFFYNKKLKFKYLPLLVAICSFFFLYICIVMLIKRFYI